jgi:dihydropteroate synthase
VIAAIKKELPDAVIAIDTVKSTVAEAAIEAGATIINDITALAGDPQMGAVATRYNTTVVLMHNRADHAQYDTKIGGHYTAPTYSDVIGDVCEALRGYADTAMGAGIDRDKIILDPGIGFGKTPQQNMALIKHLPRLKTLGFPVLMGVSRKFFIGHILDVGVDERLEGTAACIASCVANGADILRVHDVKMMARVAKMAAALRDV